MSQPHVYASVTARTGVVKAKNPAQIGIQAIRAMATNDDHFLSGFKTCVACVTRAACCQWRMIEVL